MTKPSLDQIDLQVMKTTMDRLVIDIREARVKQTMMLPSYESQLEELQQRYKHFTGSYYTYRGVRE